MTDDLSLLSPDVREAVERLRVQFAGVLSGRRIEIVVADLLRLHAENADFRRAFTDLSAKHLAVERELATLRDAPVFTCDAEVISGRDGDYISMVLKHADPAFQYPDMDDKRVRLVVEDDHA